jgi:hypothetical protein
MTTWPYWPAAGLAHELAFLLDRLADGLAVGDLRLADVGLDVELALHAVDEDLQVQLAHAGDDGLAGLFVGAHAEGRIFLRQAAQGDAHLLLVGLGLRLDRHRDDRLREDHALQRDDVVLRAQRVAGGDVLQAHRGGDVAGAHFLDLFAVVGVHLQDAADALLLDLTGLYTCVADVERARVDAEEGQRTHERVGHDLERQRRERLAVAGLARRLPARSIVDALDRRTIRRRRQVAGSRRRASPARPCS